MVEVLITKKEIKKRVKKLAKKITADYQGESLTLICILKGSIYFFADLSRQIDLDVNLEFMRVSSYQGEDSTGELDFKLDIDEPVGGKNVIVVEDIVDTGRTLSYLMDYLSSQNPRSLKLCALLNKESRREFDDVKIDYLGFEIPNRFVIGYGLDLDQKYRNLPEINHIVDDKAPQIVKKRKKK